MMIYGASLTKLLPVLVWLKMHRDGALGTTLNWKLKDLFPSWNAATKKVVDGATGAETALEREAAVFDIFREEFPVWAAGNDFWWLAGWDTYQNNPAFPYMDSLGDSIQQANVAGDLGNRAEEIFSTALATKVAQNATIKFYKQPGQFTYGSSEYFSAAVVEKRYNDWKRLDGTNRKSFEEIFKIEIGDVIGAEVMFHATSTGDARYNRVANTYAQLTLGGVAKYVHDTHESGKAHRDFALIAANNNVTSPKFCYPAAYAYGTAKSWGRVLRIVAGNGKVGGTQLIDSSDLGLLQIPAMATAQEGAQSIWGGDFSFGMGSLAPAPDYLGAYDAYGYYVFRTPFKSVFQVGAFGKLAFASVADNAVVFAYVGARGDPADLTVRKVDFIKHAVNALS
jgi:hypothetical protein